AAAAVVPLPTAAGAEEARPRDHLPAHHVDEAAEEEDGGGRGEQRPAEPPTLPLVEQKEEDRAGEECDERRGPGEPPPLVGERRLGCVGRPGELEALLGCSHRRLPS